MASNDFVPSKYQAAVFDFVEHEKGSAIIQAVAGSGTTTTIVECTKRIPATMAINFVAFNKSIADELKKRVPSYVNAQTLNGMGYQALLEHLGRPRFLKLEKLKTAGIIRDNLSKDDFYTYGPGLAKLIGLAKAHGIVPRGAEGEGLTLDLDDRWADLIERYEIEFEKGWKIERALDLARQALAYSIEISERVIDFDDQLYLPIIWQARFRQYDVIMVDESQDVNLVQRAMLRQALKPGGRLIAVGDRSQSIYGFRGADTEAMDRIAAEFTCKELPLSISYRCPKRVVAEAQRFVPYIEASATAPDGVVETLKQFNETTFVDTDGVICRNTAPIVGLAYTLLRHGKACRVLGRDIGLGLVALIKKMDANSIPDLQNRLDRYVDREVERLMLKGKEEQAGALQDRVDTIRIFIDQLKETDRSIPALTILIESLFTDNNKGLLTLCTVHKAKGLEWDRVFILDRWLMPSKYARQDWQAQQEKNIQYVAVTRAKRELYYIDSNDWTEKIVEALRCCGCRMSKEEGHAEDCGHIDCPPEMEDTHCFTLGKQVDAEIGG